MSPGIQVRHSKLCPTRRGGSCKCKPTYQANVWSARAGKRIFKTFRTLAAAKEWRTDTQVALRNGTVRAGSSRTLRAAAEAWLEGVHSGAIRNRSGHRYKPSAIRGYEAGLVSRDLAAGVIRVERSWDAKAGVIAPKSRAARRTVPIAAVLRDYLVEHKLRSGRHVGLAFGTNYAQPFTPSNVRKRANAAWERAGLEPIGLHECRHTFASLMIAAEINAKALSTYMGHSSVTITYDRYGHLMPGNEGQAAALLDGYLAREVAAPA